MSNMKLSSLISVNGHRPARQDSAQDFEGFVSALSEQLGKLFIGQKQDRSTYARVDETIYVAFECAKFDGALYLPADGMRVVGGKSTPTPNKICIQWQTEFFPHARHGGQSGDCIALGFFDGYDLYLGLQGSLPPTLIARYGSNPDEYETYNPDLLGTEELNQAGKHFVEAFMRSRFVLGICD